MYHDVLKKLETYYENIFERKVVELEEEFQDTFNEIARKSKDNLSSDSYIINVNGLSKIPSQVELIELDKKINKTMIIYDDDPTLCGTYRVTEEFIQKNL